MPTELGPADPTVALCGWDTREVTWVEQLKLMLLFRILSLWMAVARDALSSRQGACDGPRPTDQRGQDTP